MADTVTTISGSPLPYTNIEYTEVINELPQQYGYLSDKGLFGDVEPLATEFFEINIENDVITVLPVGQSYAKDGGSTGRIFRVPQIEHDDALTAKAIKNMMVLSDGGRKAETLANLTAKKLMKFRKKFDMTHEWFRWGALKGNITDGKGNVVVNLFTAFEITQKVVYFDLSNSATNIEERCNLLYQLISQDLFDETMANVQVECDTGFFNALINHPNVKEKYVNAAQALQLAALIREKTGVWQPRVFEHGNVSFHEHPAVIPLVTGPAKVVETNTGYAYPNGTQSSHMTFASPPDDISLLDGSPVDPEKANIWITEKVQDHGKGLELKGRMNVLPFWTRPKLLVKCLAGSGSSTTPTAY